MTPQVATMLPRHFFVMFCLFSLTETGWTEPGEEILNVHSQLATDVQHTGAFDLGIVVALILFAFACWIAVTFYQKSKAAAGFTPSELQNLFLRCQYHQPQKSLLSPQPISPLREQTNSTFNKCYIRSLGTGHASFVTESLHPKTEEIQLNLSSLPGFPAPDCLINGVVTSSHPLPRSKNQYLVTLRFPTPLQRETQSNLENYLHTLLQKPTNSPLKQMENLF